MARLFKQKAQFDGGILLPASAGAGKLATSDASGNISWGTALPTHASTHIPGGADAVNPVTFSATIPASPVDGQLWAYNADATAGVAWMFRYRSASSSAYKWEYVGGGRMLATVATSETRGNTAYGDLTTVGPSITVPFAGDYQIAHGASMVPPATTLGIGFMSYATGATVAVDADYVYIGAAGAVATATNTYRETVKTAVAASAVIRAKYRTSVASPTGTFSNRVLAVVPIRVG